MSIRRYYRTHGVEPWPGFTVCIACGHEFRGEGDECRLCVKRAEDETAARKDAVGKLHVNFEYPAGRLGPVMVTCFTPEARQMFGVSSEGPYEFDRSEAWQKADALQALYGDGAVFS